MRKILIIGAGRSASTLIRFLLNHAEQGNWQVIVADQNQKLAETKVRNHARGIAVSFDALNKQERANHLEGKSLVISMLPARFHVEVAKDCIELGVPVFTPSYLSEEMKELDELAKKKGVLVLNELGVDPGIDHMSAMQILDRLRMEGNKIIGFESFTGGLVAPESDNNPWNYKVTWNPRNVILAGQGGAAQFIQEGKYKYIPYNKLFRRTEVLEVEGYGKFEGYANRDSLSYRETYGLENIQTIYRGTLRRVGFCRAWDYLIQLGMTDDSYVMSSIENMTYREFTNSFLAYNPNDTVEMKIRAYLKIEHDDYVLDKLKWLGLFENRQIGLTSASPAQVLQKLIEEKWKLEDEDRDMIVMIHKFRYYDLSNKIKEIHSSFVSEGEDQTYTAMSNTVGLPLGIAAKLLLEGKLNLKGVHLPILPEIYNPILEELEEYGIVFKEKEVNPDFYSRF